MLTRYWRGNFIKQNFEFNIFLRIRKDRKKLEIQTQNQKRIDWLDIAKGIAILCIIIGHSFGKNRIGVFIFSFHMPLFFILSGYTMLFMDAGYHLHGLSPAIVFLIAIIAALCGSLCVIQYGLLLTIIRI